MDLKARIGVDLGRATPLEEALPWAAARGVRFLDVELDTGPNALPRLDDARVAAIRAMIEAHDLRLGLHTLSAVNVAERSPYLSEAADAYLAAYIDLAPRLGADWIVVHAGYHFTSDREARMRAGLERLKRATERAERAGVTLLLENLNKEPPAAEVRYLAHTVEEWRFYYEAIPSPAFGLAFTANHAHLMPEGVAGFLDAIPLSRVREVRLADCWRHGDEVHLRPGEGDFDFGDLFRRLEGAGFAGHYMNAFGSLDDMERARGHLVRCAQEAGGPAG
ncbi:sugar phosphate isomerase/epimerase family protein [Methylobacterium nonmethylotrophicum]|uniref:sugar phosphate isomerase/epimerase family protein n=1 Tax=Methylobacterium nonmethylotrophicum TaxID=1141884 RepID=UPI001FE0B3F3|nr:sugar phosphate isomerase/epimerase family protein [Methylobacterium nonmethylotrophicum]